MKHQMRIKNKVKEFLKKLMKLVIRIDDTLRISDTYDQGGYVK